MTNVSDTDAGSGGGLPVIPLTRYYFTGGGLDGWAAQSYSSFVNTASPPAGGPYPNALALTTNGVYAAMLAPAFGVVTGEVLTITAQVYSGQSPVYIGFIFYNGANGTGTDVGAYAPARTVTVNSWGQVSYSLAVPAIGAKSAVAFVELVSAANGTLLYAEAVTIAASVTGLETGTVLHSDSDAGSGSDTVTSVSASLSGSDAGSVTETSAVTAGLSGADTGSGTETSAVTAGLSGADTGSGADTYGLTASLSGADAGSGAETSVLRLSSTDAGSGGGLPVIPLTRYYFTDGGLDGWSGYQASLVNTASPPAGGPYPNALALTTAGVFASMFAPVFGVVTGEVLTITAQAYSGQSPVYIGFTFYAGPNGTGTDVGAYAVARTVTVNSWGQVSYILAVPALANSAVPLIELASAVNGTLLYAEAVTIAASVTGLETGTVLHSDSDSGSGLDTGTITASSSSTDAGSGGGLPVTQFYSYYFTGGSLNGWLGFEGSLTNTASPPAGSPYPNAAVLSTTGAFAFMYAPAVNVVTGEVLTISAQVYPGQSPVHIGFSGYPNPGGGGSSTGTFAAADTVTVNAWSQVLSYTWTVTAGTRSVLPLIELLSAVNGTLLYAEAITVTASVTGLEVASATVRLSGTDSGSGAETSAGTASLSSADTGSGTETSVLGLSSTDAGSGIDTAALAVRLYDTDSGSGVDTYKLITVYFSSDGGHGQEGDTEGYASADTGTGAESWQPPAVMTADAASGLDAGTVFASGSSADVASGLDAGQLIVTGLDSGNGAENLTQAIGIFPYPPPWLFGFGGSYLLIWRPGTPEERVVRRFDRLAPWVVRYAELIRASDSLLDIIDTDSASGRDTDIDSAPGSQTSGWGAIGLRMRVTEISLSMQTASVRLHQQAEGGAELVLLAEEG